MIKKYFFFVLIFSLLSVQSFSQGSNCSQATPFCDAPGGAGTTFPNSTSTTAQAGPSYGCLVTQPNPAWFFFKTGGAGTMVFDLSQVDGSGAGIDVDFICWGPFSNYATMCNFLTGSCSGDHNCTGNIEDCSFSPWATETMTIVSPSAGQYYAVLITNYSGYSGNITFAQSSGPATDCSITCPDVLSGDGFLQYLGAGSTQNVSGTMNCNDPTITLVASSNTAFGQPISPGVLLSFTANANTTNVVNIYQNGVFAFCYGATGSGCSQTLTPSQQNYEQVSLMSPSTPYSIELCETNSAYANFPYALVDIHSGTTISSGTWTDDGVCQTLNIPAGTLTGVATYTASCGACVTSLAGSGYGTFSPSIAGVGTHTITYTFSPGGGCPPYTYTKTVNVVNPYIATWTAPAAMCVNAASVNLNSLLGGTSTTGGTWSGTGVSGNTFNPATAGAGTFTVTYSLGSGTCSASQAHSITVNPLPTAAASNTGAYCVGQTIALSSSGGNTYSWAGPSAYSSTAQNPTRPTATTAMAGTYTVTVTSAAGCVSTATTAVTVNALPVVTASNPGPFCVGATINLSSSGGNTYSWAGPNTYSSSAQNPAIANATTAMAGTYTVTATNTTTNCSNTATTTVVVNQKPTAIITGSGATCSGVNVTLSAATSSAGSGSITGYQWQLGGSNIGGATSSTYSTSTAGTYNVIVTNSNTCGTTSANFAVTVNNLPTSVVSGPTSFCSGSSFTLGTTGSSAGTGSITGYQWQLGGVNISGATSSTYVANAAGTYNVIITNTPGCTKTSANYVVTVNSLPTAVVSGPTVLCSGTTISLSASGSTPPSPATITGYQWQLNGSNISGATSSTYGATAAGNYQVIITNSNTCTKTSANYAVSVNASPVAAVTGTSTFCSNSSTTLSASTSTAGSGSITAYQWQLNGSNIGGATSSTYTTSAAGNYSVIVTNSNACNNTSAATTLTVLPAPAISAGSVTSNPSDCGAATGSITGITATGSGTLTYTWTNSVPSTVSTSTSTANLLNQPAGTYNLTVTSTNGCLSNSGPYSIINPSAPAAPSATATSSPVCVGGSFTLSAGNILNATYSWSGPNGFNSTAQNPAALTNVTAANAGVYSVVATVSGCTGPAGSIPVTVNANPVASITGTSIFCAGANSVLSAASSSAGSGSISSYQWQLNGSNIGGATSSTYTASAAGNYQVIVTNSNNCGNTSAATVIVVNANPVAAVTGSASFCAGTNTVLSATTSTAPNPATITGYQWQLNGSNITGATSSTYTAAAAGNYQVIITNSNNCNNTSAVAAVSVNANPVAAVTGSPVFCAGTNTNLSATTSTAGSGSISTYQWQFNGVDISGATASSYTANAAGNYAVIVTNSNNCNNTSAAFAVSINANPTASVTGSNNFCTGTTTILSAATSTAGSGTISSFQWQLNGNPIAGATSSTYIANAAGNYQVIINNSNSCTNTSAVFAVVMNANPVANLTGTQQICAGTASVLSAVGSTAGSGTVSAYQWMLNGTTISGASGSSYSATTAGVYMVTVQNSNDCTDTASFSLTVNANPTAIVTANPAIICSNTVTTLDAANSNAGSGTINSYQWQLNGVDITGATTSTYVTSTAGVYSVIVGNTNNCADTSATPITITLLQIPNALASGNAEFCAGLSTVLDASASIGGSGAIASYQWLLNGTPISGAGTANYTVATAGTYQVIVTNTDNCKDTSLTITVIQNPLPVISGSTTMQQSACNGATGALTGLNVSGVSPFTYVWTNSTNVPVSSSTSSPDLTNQPAGIYLLTVTDSNGCVSTYGTDTISNIGAPPAPGYSQPAAYCQGQTINPLLATGTGVGTLTWYSNSTLTTIVGSGSPFNPSVTTASVNTYTFYVTETISGCEGPPSPITITVKPTPLAPIAGSPAATCAGQLPPALTANGGGGVITWYSNATLTTPVGLGSPYTSNLTTTTTLWVTEYLNGCEGPSTPVTVTFNPLPPAPAAVSPAAYCQGQTIAPLTATGTSGTLNWYADTTLNPSLGTGASYTVTTVTTDTFYVAEVLTGCMGPATPVYINVNPLPGLTGTPVLTDELCGGTNGGITGLLANGGTPAYTYNWTNGAGTTVGTTANLNNIPMGTYQLVVTDINGCKVNGGPYTIAGSGHVVAAFTASTTGGLAPLTVDFTNNSSGANTYNWSFGDINVSNQTNPQNIFTYVGTFTVSLIATNGNCMDTATAIIVVDIPSIVQIPNVFTPNADGINDLFMVKSEGIKQLNADIMNRWGQKVYTITAPSQSWDGRLSNGELASEGTYFYILKAVGFDGKEYSVQGSVTLVK